MKLAFKNKRSRQLYFLIVILSYISIPRLVRELFFDSIDRTALRFTAFGIAAVLLITGVFVKTKGESVPAAEEKFLFATACLGIMLILLLFYKN